MDARNEAYAAKEVDETVDDDDEDINHEVDMIFEFGDDDEEKVVEEDG